MKKDRKRNRRIDGRKFCREMLMVGRHWKVEEFLELTWVLTLQGFCRSIVTSATTPIWPHLVL